MRRRVRYAKHPANIHAGQRLTALRRALALTPAQLAIRLGWSEERVFAFEAGRAGLTAAHMATAAKALKVAPAYFIEGLEP